MAYKRIGTSVMGPRSNMGLTDECNWQVPCDQNPCCNPRMKGRGPVRIKNVVGLGSLGAMETSVVVQPPPPKTDVINAFANYGKDLLNTVTQAVAPLVPTPAAPVAAPGMSTTTKIAIAGGAAAAVYFLFLRKKG